MPLPSHSLSFNKLTDAGVQPIAQALANHPTFKWLQCDPTFSPLSLPSYSLIHISLHYNQGITDASCPALAELLRTVSTLEQLK
jgi:hypothetical protein